MDTPKEIRCLVDKLGHAMAHAISSDEAGRKLIEQIRDAGFDIGVFLEATLILHQNDSDGADESDGFLARAMPGGFFSDSALVPDNSGDFEWSEEDKALLCNFRISLD